MAAWTRWLGIGLAVGLIAALVPIAQGRVSIDNPLGRASSDGTAERPTALRGLDLTRMKLRPESVVAPLPDGKHAELTLDPDVQRAALKVMKRYQVPEGVVVLEDIKTGEIIAYASFMASGDTKDLAVVAEAPAASVFKVVTAAALVEKAGLSAKTEQCYHGGKSAVVESELIDDPKKDEWCATLAMALGRSINVIFARLAKKHLTPEELTAMGGAFGFGAPVPFVVDNEPSQIAIPDGGLEYYRAAAGFWHTTMSPLEGAVLAQTVANQGVTLRPHIVRAVYDGERKVWDADLAPVVVRRAIKSDTADELRAMMIQTVASGSGFKQFHDGKGAPFLPGMQIAGKTGTLTRHKENRHYTWFVGFAPADRPQVAVSALVVNTPEWRIKGPFLAREVLRAYFAKKGWSGVTAP